MIAFERFCPKCESDQISRNGINRHGKQNYRCHECGRQFIDNPTKKNISQQDKERIEKLLLERLSLRGICRVMEVSLSWLLDYLGELYQNTPDDLNIVAGPVDIEDFGDEKLDAMIYDFLEKKIKVCPR